MSINPVSGSASKQQDEPVAVAKQPVPPQQSAIPQDTVKISSAATNSAANSSAANNAAATAKQTSSSASDQGGNSE